MLARCSLPRGFPRIRHRLIAAVGVALVLVLSILAASPQLHAWLHRGAGQADHECAITLYQHGVTASAGATVLAVVALIALARVAAPPAELHLAPRRYWLPPGNAPPAR
jgi:hypothetical protein